MFAVQMVPFRLTDATVEPMFAAFLVGMVAFSIGVALLVLGTYYESRYVTRETRRLVGAFLIAFTLTGGTLLAAEAVRGCEVIEDAPWWFRCFVCGNCLP